MRHAVYFTGHGLHPENGCCPYVPKPPQDHTCRRSRTLFVGWYLLGKGLPHVLTTAVAVTAARFRATVPQTERRCRDAHVGNAENNRGRAILQPFSRVTDEVRTFRALLRHSFHLGTSARCRLNASPATGLVGMQENGFLSDFFGCVGFLPLTTQRYRTQCYCL